MHNAVYQAMGLGFAYVAFGTEDTQGAVGAMRTLGIRGLGVTMPHKERIGAYLDEIDETARAIGAVNTVVNDDGTLIGYNVDWLGAIAAFQEQMVVTGARAAVLGAGGGARAIAYGLVREGATVTVFNRGAERGTALAEAVGAEYGGEPEALSDRQGFDLLAHVTPVGFHQPETTLVPAGVLRRDMVVFDAVPVPVQTRLLRDAASRGCRTIPGVRMQLHQAALQFQLYTGVEADLQVMEKALADALAP
jgi:shikimate dehydrogenase